MSIAGFVSSFSYIEPVKEIKPIDFCLSTNNKEEVPTIIVIFGESFSKLHSELYGYDKPTNPRLSSIPDSLLHIFYNVHSPATDTRASFCTFMTTSDTVDIPDCFKCPNVIEIVKKAGYSTSWVSNQKERGVYDNKISLFAHLCDTVVWTTTPSLASKIGYDEDVLPLLLYNKEKSVNFIHLYGSHTRYVERYPKSFATFTEKDYQKYPSNQRKKISEYDNSILYNDSIVYSILNFYSSKDAIVLYFSDHALDLYYTDKEYCGYAHLNDEKSVYYGEQIPFMVYTSELFRRNHKSTVTMIENSVNESFSTTDFPYILMQIIGVTFEDRPNKNIFHT
jgi:heptose-I-phosphate ethanolaminephosphotransferase